MTFYEDHARRLFGLRASSDRTPLRRLKAAAVWLAEWLRSCADHYAAARQYDILFRLSDAELEHRGLSRVTLAHDLIGMREDATAAARAAPAPADRLRQDLRVLCRAHGAELVAAAAMVSIRPARAGGLPVEIVIDRGRRAVVFGDWVSDLDTDEQVLDLAEMALTGRLRLKTATRGRAREWTLERRQAGGAWTEISAMGAQRRGAWH